MWNFVKALVATNLKSALAQRGAFLLQVLFMAINNLTFFVFWWLLLRRVPSIRGWRLPDLELLFGIAATSFGCVVAVAGGVRHLSRFIDEGELDALLTQPKPTLVYALGMRSQASGFGDIAAGVGFLVVSGHVTWASAPALAVAILASAATFLGSGIVFFSLAFWLSRTESLSRQLWDVLITFALYPEPIFGGGLRLALFTVLPAAFVSFLPLRLVKEPTVAGALALAAGSLVYLALGVVVFSRGLRRYASGSRFAVFG